MIQEELLLADLCTRLPYGIKAKVTTLYNYYDPLDSSKDRVIEQTEEAEVTFDNFSEIVRKSSNIALYLRPLSSMTEEEKGEYSKLTQALIEEDDKVEYLIRLPNYNTLDWLNAHYLDYRDLIGKDLALPAPEGMYIIK